MNSTFLAAALGALVPLALAGPALAQDDYCHVSPLTPQGSGERMGYSVDVEGPFLASGATSGPAVYIHRRWGGDWQLDDRVEPPGLLTYDDRFGISVGITSNWLVVGASRESFRDTESGAAYIYKRTGSDWNFYQKLGPVGLGAYDSFGESVDIQGGTIVVGASGHAGGGGVFRYEWNGVSWVLGHFYQPLPSVQFGQEVALDGDYVIASDPYSELTGVSSGVVRVFEASGASHLVQTISPPGPQVGGRFGAEIDAEDGYVVIGWYNWDGIYDQEGTAFIYGPSAGPNPYQFETQLISTQPEENGWFGIDVAITDRFAVVGATQESVDGLTNPGVAYVFENEALYQWNFESRLAYSNATHYDGMGRAVDIDGNHPVVGVPAANVTDGLSGSVLIFSLSAPSPARDCACDTLATDYLTPGGKAGTHGTPQLRGGVPAVIGQETTIRLQNALAGAVPLLLVGLTLDAEPFDGGLTLPGDPVFLLMPEIPASGELGFAWQIPFEPALAGVELVMQAMFVDPGAAGMYQTAQTNGLIRVVGS